MEDRLFRDAMGKFATGVTVITTKLHDETHGMTANAFMSVSLNPKLIVISIDERASMLAKIQQSGTFAVNILAEDQQYLSQHFAGKREEGIDVPFTTLEGYPVLKDVVAQIVCDVKASYVEGDHTLFIGHVQAIHVEGRPPLLFYSGKYESLQPSQTSV
ncbi:flavin reductase family protein [Caryophanon latum]|uniref:Flavin reductase n=1 Tax=Caryophanon latum TaxID=33977 RepID=A0A1C0YTZ4_9BACL|nr:flavin reductase family protein [Caryophanon latum]OCS90630.1 flavin reductase [Caryophanon latum]